MILRSSNVIQMSLFFQIQFFKIVEHKNAKRDAKEHRNAKETAVRSRKTAVRSRKTARKSVNMMKKRNDLCSDFFFC